MKILFILERYPGFGGIETVTKLLANAFANSLGHEVAIFSTIQQDNASQLLDKGGIQVISANANCDDGFKRFVNFINLFLPDVVIYQDSYIDNSNFLALLPLTSKVIVCEHNTPDCLLKGLDFVTKQFALTSPKNIYRRLRLPFKMKNLKKSVVSHHKKLYEICDRYILLSEKFREILDDICDVKGEKIRVIPNPTEFNNTIVPKREVALFVARLVPQKGINYLIDIWELVTKKNNLKLIILGDGEQREWIYKEIRRRNLKNIELVGFTSHVESYYEMASIHLMTSIYEGFGVTNIEAMSKGCIPFAFDSFSSIHDIIDNNKNGFIIPPFDTKTYAKKILDFFNYPEEEKMSMRISAMNKSRTFSIENITNQWVDLFNELSIDK